MKKLFVLALAFTVCAPVFAAQPVQFLVSEDFSYDDNIYLKDKNFGKTNPSYGEKKDSFISTTRVGADYKTQLPGTSLHLKARTMVGYNAYTEKPGTNNFWDASGVVDVSNKQLHVGDRIVYTSDPANNALTDRAKRLNNTAYMSYKTTNQKLVSVGVSVEDIFDRYFEGTMDYLNRNRFNVGTQLFYNFNTQTNLFAEYMFSDIVYQDNGSFNSVGHRLGVGFNGQLAPKVTGTAKVTYDMRDYSHRWNDASNHPDLVGYYTALTWKLSTRDTLRLAGERHMEETRYLNNRYFADTLLSLYGAHKFNSKWTAALTLAWEDMDYSRTTAGLKKRHDTLYTVRPQLDYKFKDWLMASVWYQYRTRQSNHSWAKYDNHKAGLTIKALF